MNLYVYAYLSLLKNLVVTVGASGDLFNSDSSSVENTNQFNPKFGVVWNPWPATTVRAAVFRVLKRTLITDQTLEPTQVAGFNQFFDDFNATDAWRYGVAIDQKFTPNLYGGLEFSKRALKVPFQLITATTDDVQRADADEDLGRAYLFWTPHRWLAFSAEYQYERFERDEAIPLSFKEVSTHRVPLGVRVFHPTGWRASFKAMYVHQNGDFVRPGIAGFTSGEDDFWVVDAAISYRLPKRYGLVTIGVANLFDETFNYQETALENTLVQPDRMVFGQLTLALP